MEIFTATMGILQLCHAGCLPPSIFPMRACFNNLAYGQQECGEREMMTSMHLDRYGRQPDNLCKSSWAAWLSIEGIIMISSGLDFIAVPAVQALSSNAINAPILSPGLHLPYVSTYSPSAHTEISVIPTYVKAVHSAYTIRGCISGGRTGSCSHNPNRPSFLQLAFGS